MYRPCIRYGQEPVVKICVLSRFIPSRSERRANAARCHACRACCRAEIPIIIAILLLYLDMSAFSPHNATRAAARDLVHAPAYVNGTTDYASRLAAERCHIDRSGGCTGMEEYATCTSLSPIRPFCGVFATNSGIAPRICCTGHCLAHIGPAQAHIHICITCACACTCTCACTCLWVCGTACETTVFARYCLVTPRQIQKPPKVGFGNPFGWVGDGARRRALCARLDGPFGTIPGAKALGVLRTLVYVATASGGISRRG